jgi:hypothetical protein
MKRIFVAMLSLPLLTSVFFIMCTKAPDKIPETAPKTTQEASAAGVDVAPVATDKSKLEKIEIHTESINGAVHWMPAEIKVSAGKEYLLVAKHELTGGFDFHGLMLKDFGVQAQVNRNKEYSTVISIPAEKKGSFVIGCQFHPKHQAAKLIVE